MIEYPDEIEACLIATEETSPVDESMFMVINETWDIFSVNFTPDDKILDTFCFNCNV